MPPRRRPKSPAGSRTRLSREDQFRQELAEEMDAIQGAPADVTIEPPGWLSPEGLFWPSIPTPSVRIRGLELGGHERAAHDWLEANRPSLYAELETERRRLGFEIYEDSDGSNLIKNFMFAHGFLRIADDHSTLTFEGNPTPLQRTLLRAAAILQGVPLRHLINFRFRPT